MISKTIRYIGDDIWINADGIRTDKDGVPFESADPGVSNGTSETLKNVKDPEFGAIGNGIADDTVAIQAAIDAAIAGGTGVKLPKGIYKITAELTFHTLHGFSIVGEGPMISVIRQVTNGENALHCTDTGGINHVSLREFSLECPYPPSSTKSCLLVDTSAGASDSWLLSHVSFTGGLVGFRGSQFSNGTLVSCLFFENGTCVYLDDSSNSVSLFGCDYVQSNIGGLTGIGIRYSSGIGMNIVGNDFGGPHQLKALLADGGHLITWSSSNCECYSTTSDGYIDHATASGHLILNNVAVKNFGGAGCYSLRIAGNYTVVSNCLFEKFGASTGAIKQAQRINSEIYSDRPYSVDVFNETTGLFVEQHLSGAFYTISSADGVTPSASTKGFFKLKFNTGGADDNFYFFRQASGGSYVMDDLGQYATDVRAGLLVKTNVANSFSAAQTLNKNLLVGIASANTDGGLTLKSNTKWHNLWSDVHASGDFGLFAAASNGVLPDYSTALTVVYVDASNRTHIGWNLASAPTGTDMLNVYGTAKITGGIKGVIDASTAAAGIVGQVIQSLLPIGSKKTLQTPNATGVAEDLTSISLTAGDWDVSASVQFQGITSGNLSAYRVSINTTSATHATDGTELYELTTTNLVDKGYSIPRKIINVSSNTTVYLVVTATLVSGSAFAYGSLIARRIR